MTAGVPGTGIGGLFYLVAGLLLPFRKLFPKVGRGGERWRSTRLGFLALGVLLGIVATGWLLGLVLGPVMAATGKAAGLAGPIKGGAKNIVRWIAFLAGFATLGLVLLSVQIARIFARRR